MKWETGEKYSIWHTIFICSCASQSYFRKSKIFQQNLAHLRNLWTRRQPNPVKLYEYLKFLFINLFSLIIFMIIIKNQS